MYQAENPPTPSVTMMRPLSRESVPGIPVVIFVNDALLTLRIPPSMVRPPSSQVLARLRSFLLVGEGVIFKKWLCPFLATISSRELSRT